ncbi:MAG: hypothetical protein K2J46_10775, partial [Muribaculaceae bacterium]|nr:hypothetical protein [Muribaculaceae bacterium]
MELKAKRLYIFTIAAILSLLAVQTLWLYNQYRMTIDNEKASLMENLNAAITEYGYIRFSSSDKTDSLVTSYTRSALSYGKNDTIVQGYVEIKISHETRKIRDLLKITDNRPISKEDKEKASQILSTLPFDSLRNPVKTYRLPTSTDASKLYEAMSDASTESRCPFTLNGIDSILRKKDLTVTTGLAISDTLLWRPIVKTSMNPVKPEIKVLYPYSPLDHKCIEFYYAVPLSNVLRSMGLILILCVVLSIFLVICLVCQIRMILVYARLDSIRNSFVHTMIHELKRPLSTLKLCISVLSNRKMMENEETRISILEKCKGAINNLSTYFSRLRDITFNEASQIPLGIESCNVRQLVEEMIDKTDIPYSKKVEFHI